MPLFIDICYPVLFMTFLTTWVGEPERVAAQDLQITQNPAEDAIYSTIYSITNLETSILGSGNFNFILSNVLTMI
jgi:hypothetical protein